ncbi:MAG: hypothetical protein GY865_11615 [candidate division Zixibacteria bacterium]|nr:hypothetical protein [candidate division Zixibacteria bacterium]
MVYWNYESVGAGVALGRITSGFVISMTKSCDGPCEGMYEAIKFQSGALVGITYGSPIGGNYNNQEIFEDSYLTPDVNRVTGNATVFSGTMAAHKIGKSGGAYKFGELYGTEKGISDAEGWDFGVDFVQGKTKAVGNILCFESPFLDQIGE